jgi:hypothetical protein
MEQHSFLFFRTWKVCTIPHHFGRGLIQKEAFTPFFNSHSSCSKSIPISVQYVTLHIKIRWRKVNICQFGLGNWFFSCIFVQITKAGNKHNKTVHMLQKSVINMIWLLVLVFDWPIIMIAPGGLLLVVPTYLHPMFQFYGWG